MFKVWGLSIPKNIWMLISIELFLVFLCMNISLNMSYEILSFENAINNSLILLLIAISMLTVKR